jgi:hypothetical protein
MWSAHCLKKVLKYQQINKTKIIKKNKFLPLPSRFGFGRPFSRETLNVSGNY